MNEHRHREVRRTVAIVQIKALLTVLPLVISGGGTPHPVSAAGQLESPFFEISSSASDLMLSSGVLQEIERSGDVGKDSCSVSESPFPADGYNPGAGQGDAVDVVFHVLQSPLYQSLVSQEASLRSCRDRAAVVYSARYAELCAAMEHPAFARWVHSSLASVAHLPLPTEPEYTVIKNAYKYLPSGCERFGGLLLLMCVSQPVIRKLIADHTSSRQRGEVRFQDNAIPGRDVHSTRLASAQRRVWWSVGALSAAVLCGIYAVLYLRKSRDRLQQLEEKRDLSTEEPVLSGSISERDTPLVCSPSREQHHYGDAPVETATSLCSEEKSFSRLSPPVSGESEFSLAEAIVVWRLFTVEYGGKVDIAVVEYISSVVGKLLGDVPRSQEACYAALGRISGVVVESGGRRASRLMRLQSSSDVLKSNLAEERAVMGWRITKDELLEACSSDELRNGSLLSSTEEGFTETLNEFCAKRARYSYTFQARHAVVERLSSALHEIISVLTAHIFGAPSARAVVKVLLQKRGLA